ncbi:CDP-diacylglycerol--serine O-phosphatidyltransferase [bacterium]|nr:CDP-diacylglycerol--serine O-phosphatidyltransferase [bacterium]
METDNQTKQPKEKAFNKLSRKTKGLRRRMHMNIYVLPNLLTTGNMFFGFFGIIHAVKGEFVIASYAVVGAAIFDLLDGRVARMTRSESEFGAQYDSLSDLVSFGLAPAILLFYWALEPFNRIGWLATFFYVACGALRLARFNVTHDIDEKSHFQGLPIPMAAGIVASSVMAFNDLGLDATKSWIILGITFLLGFVMVSSFPYRSFKDLDLKKRLPFKYLVVSVFLFAIIAIRPEVMLFVLFLTYAVLGAIFGVLKLGRSKKELANEPAEFEEYEEE